MPRLSAKVGLPKRERLLSVVGGNAFSWAPKRSFLFLVTAVSGGWGACHSLPVIGCEMCLD